MANVIIFNEADNKIIDYKTSVNTPDYSSRTDVIVNPDLSALSGIPRKYWKQDSGAIVEMTQAEKDAVDAEEVQAQLEANRATADKLGFSTEDVITALVKVINIRIPNNPITKSEVVAQLKNDKGL